MKRVEYEAEHTEMVTKTFSFRPVDIELIEWITKTLGCSRSDAVRTAIRAYAHSLAKIKE